MEIFIDIFLFSDLNICPSMNYKDEFYLNVKTLLFNIRETFQCNFGKLHETLVISSANFI